MTLTRTLLLSTALLIPMSMSAYAQTAPQPAQRAQSATATAVVVTDPVEFAALASSSNLFEIQSSELALQRSQNQDVRGVAQRMIDDHTASSQRMTEAAQQDGIPMSTAMDQRHQEILNQLSAQEGEAFDAAYLEAQAQAHNEAVALFEGFAASAGSGALAAFAAETVPTLQAHHEMVSGLASGQPVAGDQAQNQADQAQMQSSNQSGAILTPATPEQTAAMASGQQASSGGFITQQQMNQLMGTRLMDAEVIGADGGSIGPVEDVLLDAEGRILAVLVNVGGFLGIGARNVAIDVNSLKILVAGTTNESGITSPAADAATIGGTGTAPGVANQPAAPGSSTAATSNTRAPGAPEMGLGGGTQSATGWGTGWGEMGQIQSIVVDFTREQIENAPEFVYLEDAQ